MKETSHVHAGGRARPRARPAALGLLVAVLFPNLAGAHPGDLDPQFGQGGTVVTDFGGHDYGEAQAVQKDGSILVGGTTQVASGYDAFVARYTPAGKLDTNWGIQGRVTVDFGGDDDEFYALAVQKDGRILAAGTTGTSQSPPYPHSFALARFLPDGTPDPGFGPGGKVITSFNGGDEEIYGLALQKAGGIIVVGQSSAGGQSHLKSGTVARYLSNGKLDAAFGQGGRMTAVFGGLTARLNSVALQKDGRIVAAGTAFTPGSAAFIVARYRTDGSFDPTFGPTGFAVAAFAGASQALGVAVQKDGRIVAAGWSDGAGSNDFALARFRSNGKPDLSFGGSGLVLTDFGSGGDYAYNVGIQPGGKIVAVGTGGLQNGPYGFALARYTKKGLLDASFGQGGRAVTPIGTGAAAGHLSFVKGGRILISGQTGPLPTVDVALARYLGK